MTLREDLVKERMKSEEISESLDGLHKQLKQVGLDPHTLKDDTMILSKSKNLEGSLNKLVENRERKIEALETTLKDIRDENCSLKQNIEVQKLKSGGDNNFIEAQLKTVVQERDELRGELSKVRKNTFFIFYIQVYTGCPTDQYSSLISISDFSDCPIKKKLYLQ